MSASRANELTAIAIRPDEDLGRRLRELSVAGRFSVLEERTSSLAPPFDSDSVATVSNRNRRLQKMVRVLIQADKFGASISQTLENFSDFMRVSMRQEAEEKVAKRGVKPAFPSLFFILPSLFVVTVGPMMVAIMRDFCPRLRVFSPEHNQQEEKTPWMQA